MFVFLFFFYFFLFFFFGIIWFFLSFGFLTFKKMNSFESGFNSIGKIGIFFSLNFFIILLVFVIFDLEFILLFSFFFGDFNFFLIFLFFFIFVFGLFFLEWFLKKMVWFFLSSIMS